MGKVVPIVMVLSLLSVPSAFTQRDRADRFLRHMAQDGSEHIPNVENFHVGVTELLNPTEYVSVQNPSTRSGWGFPRLLYEEEPAVGSGADLLNQTTNRAQPPYWGIGFGVGAPYGLFGGKVSLGTSLIEGNIGVGVLPLAWSTVYSGSGVLNFPYQHANVRPKLTVTYSNAVGVILLFDQSDLEVLHDEIFSGIAVYAGIDWRLGKTSPFSIDLNIGWVFPSVGNDEIRRRYDAAVTRLRKRGYSIQSGAL